MSLQNALNNLGYGPLNLDGNFGPQTTNAVKIFQQNLGLRADGIVEQNTWSVITQQVTLPSEQPSLPIAQMSVGNQSSPQYQPTPSSPSVSVAQMPANNQLLAQRINQAILKAALSLQGMSTAEGPDGGNNACAWSLNHVLQTAGIPALGENPNYVPSLVEALQGGRGLPVSPAEALAGDLVVAYGEAHIGLALDDGCTTVLSNSSSRARFSWQSDTDFDGYYGGPSKIYRLLK